ncbi:branched-chain amino acid ABC transporter permease [Paenibacillus sp. J31TS4]|uniref:branched-chain amino acid ABC transporter permease n=1 Tax=Paenibacillus sp. J31TS4 TaxID=2807195 RepID=UPI001B1F52D9|nr:branched-chain amino acid ABC transporter permease [Paenibacillus sp. J31TS4]GIP41253.1 branched-chain amino acid ABC transporter permease [Paenibacillus sp. J31TS4]
MNALRKYALPLLVVLALLFPLVVTNAYYQRIGVMSCIFAIVASSLGLLVGQVKLVSAGHAAFFGIGAYTSALLTTKAGMPFLVGFAVAIVLSGLVGFLFSVPVLRLKGHYLSMATLAFGIVAQMVMLNWEGLTNGPNGVPGIPFASLFAFELNTDVRMFYFTFALLALLLWGLSRLYRSPVGLTFQLIREDAVAAATLGVNVTRYKVTAFTLSAGIAGLGGSLFAHYMAYINYDTFYPLESFMLLAMVVVGGMYSLFGPVLGAVLLTAVPELLRGLADYRMLIYGVVLVSVLLLRPQGILSGRPKHLELRPKEGAKR